MTSSIRKFYAGRSLFITGGSGYVGKQLVEKLLRSCPEIDQINLLMRPKKNMSPHERLQEVLRSPVFDRVKQENPKFNSKIAIVSGDTHLDRLGISDADHTRLTSNVSIVLHCAASLNFAEPLRDAVRSNVISTQRVLALAKETKNIAAFVHVSTAYSQVDKAHINEEVYDAPTDPNKLLAMIDLLSDEELALITPRLIKGRPNTYTFTKACAEKLVEEQRGHVPVSIIRPSIVTPSLAEPFKGWVDNYSAANGLILGASLGAVANHMGKKGCLVDFVPVDMTANAIIATAWDTALRGNSSPTKVYNFTSANENPFTFGEMTTIITHNARKYPTPQRLGRPAFVVESIWALRQFDVLFWLPLRAQVLDMVLKALGKKPRAAITQMRFSQLQAVLEYFTTNHWPYSTDNVVNLRKSLSPADQKEFNFNLTSFVWKDYMVDYWMGLRKYVLKDKMEQVVVEEKKLSSAPVPLR